MEDKRTTAVWVAVALLLVVPAIYVGSYFLISEKGELPEGTVYRGFPAYWQAVLYDPLIEAESFITGERIGGVTYRESGIDTFQYRGHGDVEWEVRLKEE